MPADLGMFRQPPSSSSRRETRRPTIVHLAVEYNTPQRPKTTTAIEWMVERLDEYENIVLAYRRIPRSAAGMEVECQAPTGRVFDFPYFGLPLGLGLKSAMRTAAKRSIRLLEREGIRPDVVHAHKLTFEGIAGWYVARHFGVPLLLSVRGEVETKVFRAKPELRPFLRRMCRDAANIYFVSAWFREEFQRHLPGLDHKERLLPNIVRNIAPKIPLTEPEGNHFVSIFHLDAWKRKGLVWLLDGFARAVKHDPTLRLDLIGGGSKESIEIANRLIAKRGLVDHVKLIGKIENAKLLQTLPQYKALLMPSLNETFGMVYVEALFSGIPILFTKDTAIDGYLEGLDVARTVAPRDAAAIGKMVIDLSRDNTTLRRNISEAAPLLFERFDPNRNLDIYRVDITKALASHV